MEASELLWRADSRHETSSPWSVSASLDPETVIDDLLQELLPDFDASLEALAIWQKLVLASRVEQVESRSVFAGFEEPPGYIHQLCRLAACLMHRFDEDEDGLLRLSETRQMMAVAMDCSSKESASWLTESCFVRLCSDPRGLSAVELVELLDLSAGSLGGPPAPCGAGRAFAAVQEPMAVPARRILHILHALHLDRLPVPAPELGSFDDRCKERAALKKDPGRALALSDALDRLAAVHAIREGDAETVEQMLVNGLLWDPDFCVLDVRLKLLLGTSTSRFPLLWLSTCLPVWQQLVLEFERHRRLGDAFRTEVEGIPLPAVLALAGIHGPALLKEYCSATVSQPGIRPPKVWFWLCLCRKHDIQPLVHLLRQPFWRQLVKELVSWCGIPHDAEVNDMALVSAHLAAAGQLDAFLQACEAGGETLLPKSSACAGFFLGLLHSCTPPARCLEGLCCLRDVGVDFGAALHSDLHPLHAAARWNSVHAIEGLLALGAKLHQLDSQNRTALDVASTRGSDQAAAALKRAAVKLPTWDQAAGMTTRPAQT